jgi:hypothetical protein
VELLLRLAIAPFVVLVATVAQRRFGHILGGRLVGLPLTTGPFLLLLCLTRGEAEAARAATGIVAGQVSVVVFCIAYGWLARRLPWGGTLAAAITAGVGCATLLAAAHPRPWVAAVTVLVTIGSGLVTWPRSAAAPSGTSAPRPFETFVRMAVTGVLVACLAGAVRLLGPYLAGVLSTYPLILSVMTPSTHSTVGAGAAAELVRGTLVSMVGTVVFVTALAYGLVPLGAGAAFAVAVAGRLAGDGAARAVVPRLATATAT